MSRGDRKAIIVRDRPDLDSIMTHSGPGVDRECMTILVQLEPSMPSAVDRPIVGLLRSQGREPGQPGADAAHRRVVPEVSVLRLPSDGAAVTARRHSRRPSPSSPAHAVDGSSGHLSAAEDQRATPGASDYPYLLKRLTIDRPNAGLVRRHHLHSGEPRLPCIWSRSWTGPHATFCPGDCRRTPWMPGSASRH